MELGENIPRANEGGWTLIELLVVIALLGITANFAGPSIALQIAKISSTDQGSQLITALRSARLEALRTGQAVNATFDLKEKTLIVQDKIVADFAETSQLNVVAAQSLMEPGKATFIFWPDGTSTGGSIQLKSAKSTEISVSVDWLEGINRDS